LCGSADLQAGNRIAVTGEEVGAGKIGIINHREHRVGNHGKSAEGIVVVGYGIVGTQGKAGGTAI